jgi:hypothetical protein
MTTSPKSYLAALTVEVIPYVGLKVTDHSTLGTHFLSQQYLNHSQFRSARFESLSDDDERLISDARDRIDDLA